MHYHSSSVSNHFFFIGSILDLCLALGSADVCIVYLLHVSILSYSAEISQLYLGCKLQARQGFAQMCLQRTDHDKHERLAVAS